MSIAPVDQQISVKPYLAYRDSGLPWIEKIPEHWDVLPNFAVFAERIERSFNTLEMLSVTIDQGVTKQTDLLKNSSKKDSSKEDKSQYKRVGTGDIAYNKMRMWQGAVGTSEFEGLVSPAYIVLSSRRRINPRYYHYLLRTPAYTAYSRAYSYGICDDQLSLRFDDFKRMYSPVPPIDEQDLAARFLDSRLAEVDAFIVGKRRLIELLNEQKAIIINRAVTRGIDPNAKLKPSGIEWLGRIPEHWDVRRLKFLATIKYGLGQPPKEKAGGLPLIRATNIMRGKVTDVGMVFVDPLEIPWGRDPILREDDIVVVRSGAYTADSAIIPKHYDGAIIGYDMVVRAAGIHPRFLALALLSHYVVKHQLYLEKMRAAQPHLNAEELGNTLVVFPDNPEQDRIAHYIERETRGIEEAIARAEREIELTNEYRTALISDVVTGKIDVRGVDGGNFGINSEPFTEDTDA